MWVKLNYDRITWKRKLNFENVLKVTEKRIEKR